MFDVRGALIEQGPRTNRALADLDAPGTVRQEHSFARNFRDVVEEFIHRLKAKIRHPDRIDVGITKRDAQLRATLQHPAVFGGELSFIAFDNSLHREIWPQMNADRRG